MKVARRKLPFRSKVALFIFLGILTGNLLVVSNAFAEASEETQLLFLGNKNIPPVVYLNDNGAPAGVAVDIVQALAKRMSHPVEIKATDWTAAQELVASGKAAALIQINPTEERKKIYDFSEPLLESQFSIFTTADRVGISGKAELRGLRVGVEAGGLPLRLLEKEPQIQIAIIPNFLEGFRLLNEGEIDAVVVDFRVGGYVLAQHKIRNIKVTGEPIAFSYSAIAVKKGNTELLNEINLALRTIKNDGTYQHIIDNWEPKEVVFQTREQIMHKNLLLIACLLFLSAVVWLITLKNQLSKRKVAEEKLREQYSTLRSITDSVSSPIFSVDRQYRYTSFNQEHAAAMRALYGTEIELGQNMLAYMTVPADREIAKRNIDRALIDGHITEEAYSGEELRSRRYFRVSHSPVKAGRETIGVAVLVHDITERKRLEEQMQLSEEKFHEIFQLCPDSIVIVRTADGVFVDINDGVTRLYGLSREEIVGKTSGDLDIWTQSEDIDLLLESRKDHKELTNQEIIFRDNDGNTKCCLVSNRFININGESHVVNIIRDISRRKQMEEQLRLSEEKFSKVFQLSPDAITISRLDGTFMAVNYGFTRMSGYAREEAIGTTSLELGWWVYPWERDRTLEELESYGIINDSPARYRRKDGNIVYALTSARLINIDGENCILAIVHDITEQKLDDACEAILHYASAQILAETPLDTILDNVCRQLVSVFELSLAWVGRQLPGGSQQVEAAAGELAPSIVQLAANWDAEADQAFPEILFIRDGNKLVLQTKEQFAGLQKAAGLLNIDWGEVGSGLVLPLRVQGEPIAAALGLVSRREGFWNERMQERLENFASQLAVAVNAAHNRQKLILLRTGLETVKSAISIYDRNQDIEWVNPAFVKMSGYDYAELIGRNAAELKCSFSDLQHAPEAHRQIADAIFSEGEWRGEMNLFRKDGSMFPADMVITAIRNDQGEIVNSISVYYDITEKKQAMEAMLAAKEDRARAEKLFSLGALSAGISHEINQPLNSIKMIASGITYGFKKGKKRDVAEVIPKIEEISEQVDRINSIVNQLRTLTRRREVANSRCSLNAAVRQSLRLVSRQMKDADIRLIVHLDEGLPLILANVTSLEEIVINLLINAKQALDTVDKPAKEIVVQTSFDGDVVLTVSDNGPGISAEVGQKIFDPFFSSKCGGENMGLGLAIVHSLVNSYKGAIYYKSDGENGAVFTVRFPAANKGGYDKCESC